MIHSMKIIISPAKKMTRPEGLEATKEPVFSAKALEIASFLHSVDKEEMKEIMKASDKIIDETRAIYDSFMADNESYPALLSYDGIQYKYMAQDVFTEKEYEYLEEHLRILSALYGILTPFTAIKPYRLEMQAKIRKKDMYSVWGRDIYDELTKDDDVILNLASEEYTKAVRKYFKGDKKLIDVFFYQRKDGKLKEQATYAKMMRGRAVRFLAENGTEDPDELKKLSDFDYRYSEEESEETKLVFIKEL